MLFLVLVGISLAISFERRRLTENEPDMVNFNRHMIYRGCYIFGLGVILTIISFIILPGYPIYFGILQLIGVSIIISIVLIRLKSVYLFYVSMFLILLGNIITHISAINDNIFQYILGFHTNIRSVDYFPLVYWLSFVVFGIAIGKLLYQDNKRQFSLLNLCSFTKFKAFSWLAKHSLLIYLLHQPIIIGVLLLIKHFIVKV